MGHRVPLSTREIGTATLSSACPRASSCLLLLTRRSAWDSWEDVAPLLSFNSSKGVIRSRDLEGVSEDKMLGNFTSQGVLAVKRIHICWNNELVPTNTFILTFSKPLLPDSIKAAHLDSHARATCVRSIQDTSEVCLLEPKET